MFSIGIDYGTESGRVLIIKKSGEIVGSSVIKYKHGVISKALPNENRTPLPNHFALQHPNDYLDVLKIGIPKALKQANVNKNKIVGIGIAFTSSTILPTDSQLEPLCLKNQFKSRPQAWPKLWKHHHAEFEANTIYNLASKEKVSWLKKYGNNISAEWFVPKCLEMYNNDLNLYEQTDLIIEAGDWITSILVGDIVRSNCSLSFKAFWDDVNGIPYDFLKKLNKDFGNSLPSKLRGDIKYVGKKAGYLNGSIANEIGLQVGTPVAVPIIDAHSSLIGIGASEENQLTMVMGTSTCHLMLSKEEKIVEGISGVTKDTIIPGLYAYEAGQSAVGDLFAWYMKQIPERYVKQASEKNISLFDMLNREAEKISPGESGLVALDWHNGNRSILSNSSLSGLIAGMTLHTTPVQIYRTLLEATAFNAKTIIGQYEMSGLEINEVFACGGIPIKNPLLMQIYSDILNKEIKVVKTQQASAIGAAILGAVSGNLHPNIKDATKAMGNSATIVYTPNESNSKTYKDLYEIYKHLHDYFGIRDRTVMEKLNLFREKSHSS